MRWSNLTLAADEQRQLPGYREQALVRRFDAPEALDIRFYEVRARSALNRVPGASRMPFSWTVNPYRGCTHACAYCLWGGTPILMADGRSRPLAHLRVGDEICGTTHGAAVGAGPGSPPERWAPRDPGRLTVTRVDAKWSTVKRAYRVLLANGSELLASGDHRFLTSKGWRYVSADDPGQGPRAHLVPGSRLIGIAAAARAGTEARGPAARLGAGRLVRVTPSRPASATNPDAGSDGGSLRDAPLQVPDALCVVAVEALETPLRMYDITTASGDFVAGGVVSHNCFARPTHRYLDFGPGRDFEREIVVKVNAPELLRAELARPSWKHEPVALGTNTDPYQWVEGRYELMVGIWEAMRDAHGGAGNPCSVLTKSPLLLRDVALMREIAARTQFSACLSIPTLDERAWRASEPHTPNPRARLEAVAELGRAGISTGVLIAPLMPGINDAPHQLEPLIQGVIDAGATSVAGSALHLRRDVREVFMQWLGDQRPELVPRYRELYARGAYAPRAERERLAGLVRDRRRGRVPGRGRFVERSSRAVAAAPHQETLF